MSKTKIDRKGDKCDALQVEGDRCCASHSPL